MVGGVFDRHCNGPGAGCVELPGGGWVEGQTLKKVSYIGNGSHYGRPSPGCCSCCRPHGWVCPHGYDPNYELDANGKYTTDPPTLLGCVLNVKSAVAGRYWVGQTLSLGNATRCYCGCCPCTPDEVAFSMVKCEIIVDGKARPVSNVNKELDAWGFELKGIVDPCYETQKMGSEGYVDRCGVPTPSSFNTLAGICNGGSSEGGGLNRFGDNPEYTKQDRKHMYIEAYGFDGKICESNDEAPLPDRPAFPFFNAEGGMSIIAALCCCKTGNAVEVPELPYNWDNQPEDDVQGLLGPHICPAEKGFFNGTDANNVANYGILAACPSENAGVDREAKFHHNGPNGGLSFPINSHIQTDYETDYNSFCGLECYRFTLFPKRFNKIPFLYNMQWIGEQGDDPTNPVFWKQIWGIDGVDGRATCTPCSKKMMKFYHPESDNERVTTAERQDNDCNVFKSFYAREFNGDPDDWKTYEFNADHDYANSLHHTIAKPFTNFDDINEMGSHRLLYGTCQTNNSKFTLTVTGSFDIGCDCQTGFLSCYKSHPGFAENAIGNYYLSPLCWKYAKRPAPHNKNPWGFVGPCNPHDHMLEWEWSNGAVVGSHGCPGNGGFEGTSTPWFMDSDTNYWSKYIPAAFACEYNIPCGSYSLGGAQSSEDGANGGAIGVDDTGWDWGPGCTNGPVRDDTDYACIKVWKQGANPVEWFSRTVMVWNNAAGGQYIADDGKQYVNICAPWPVFRHTPPVPGPDAWTCDGDPCLNGDWYQSAVGSYNTVDAGNIIGCGGDWCPPRCSEAACGERADCAPAQDDCCGPCINCYGEAEGKVAKLPGNICGHGFMKNGEGNCWPSSDYMSYVRLNYVAEIS